jgi:lipoprotein NlpD
VISEDRKIWLFWLLFILLLSQLHGCAPPRKVAVEERVTVDPRLDVEDLGGAHIRIVQPGDTLYGIAFENGLDANRLAAWNGITNQNRLPVGQRLRLTRPIGFVTPKKSNPPVKTSPERSAGKTATVRSTSSQSSQVTPASRKKPAGRATDAGIRWRWPTQGRVIQSYAKKDGHQGVDIEGQPDQPVLAAAAGEVVYVGNGLKGYGNLVILKHDEVFLSAYAHNQETFVQEGQRIAAAQRIGSVGRNRAGKNALHFQIRRHGEPVNPMDYFPK